MRFAILQLNPWVGALEKNFADIEKSISKICKASSPKPDLFITSELGLWGYPPRDLLTVQSLQKRQEELLRKLALLSKEWGVGLLVGHVEYRERPGLRPYNAASLFDSGKLIGTYRKQRLANYNIFSERFYFAAWEKIQQPLLFRGLKLGISICEDNWNTILAYGIRDVLNYPPETNPCQHYSSADLLINISASPFNLKKRETRQGLFSSLAYKMQKPLIYANTVGAQDDIIFDGNSFFVEQDGNIAGFASSFAEDIYCAELEESKWKFLPSKPQNASSWAELKGALVLGIRDYVQKSAFTKIVLGLSGGIDSALLACLACEAVGARNVLGLSLPMAGITSKLSMIKAKEQAQRLKIAFRELPLAPLLSSFKKLRLFPSKGLAFENLQARLRGILLMGVANTEKRLLLSTANKSELAMGYSTLYGDMCGALAPLGDLYKTEVYGLSHYLNSAVQTKSPLIPVDILLRAPTAELAPGQKDTDNLPFYEVLDGLLMCLIENQGSLLGEEGSWNTLLGKKHTVSQIKARLHQFEYKRKQAPPVLRVHLRAFGSGWDMPLVKGSP